MKKLTTFFYLFLCFFSSSIYAQTDLTGAVVSLSPTSFEYDGTAKEPTVLGIRKGTKRYNSLQAGTDYDLSYDNNVHAGTATATLTFKGNYTGVATSNFTINPKGLSKDVTLELEKYEYDYDGTAIEPAISDLYYGETKLINGIDYDISYTNNINPGTATVAVTFKGDYYGKISESFSIAIKPGSDVVLKGSCGDNVNYTFYNKSGVLSITGTGAMYDYSFYSSPSPWEALGMDVKTVEISEGVTTIGEDAFYGCSGLTSIEIPNSVKSIGASAFCRSGLTSVTIGNSVTSIGYLAFYYCSGLTEVTIPNSVTSIGESAFSECYVTRDKFINNSSLDAAANNYWGLSLVDSREDGFCINDGVLIRYSGSKSSVIIPNSVTSIGSEAFRGCTGLTSVTIGNSVTSIGSDAFHGCSGLTSIVIPNSVTSIGASAFYYCTKLASVTIGNGVTEIGSYAFYNCTKLASVTIPNSVTSIGEGAFSYCSGLTSVTIGNSVTSIGNRAFENCSGLTSVTIPNSVTSIGYSAFEGCKNLTSVTITDLDAWCKIEFRGAYSNPLYYAHHLYLNGSEVKNLVISNSVTSIGDYAFYNCYSLTSVTIPNSVTKIGSSAFSGCSGLTSVTIGNNVASIGNYSFNGCSGLTSVTIPNSVTSIGYLAFSGCTSLTEVYCYAEKVPSPYSDIFGDIDVGNTTLYVPRASIEAYKTADAWRGFGSIVGLDMPVLRGDLNGDGLVNMSDVMFLVQKILNGKFPDE